jgi:hypothetical protein
VQPIADVVAVDLLEGSEIEPGNPFLMHEPFQQVAHHPRVRKEQLVRVIVLAHSTVPCASLAEHE